MGRGGHIRRRNLRGVGAKSTKTDPGGEGIGQPVERKYDASPRLTGGQRSRDGKRHQTRVI